MVVAHYGRFISTCPPVLARNPWNDLGSCTARFLRILGCSDDGPCLLVHLASQSVDGGEGLDGSVIIVWDS